MSGLSLVITATLGLLIGMAIKDDKPDYGIPLFFVLVFHIIMAVS